MGIIKKGLLTGIGAASIAAEKAEKIVKMVVAKGLISRKDGAGLVRKLITEAERERKRIEKIVSSEVGKQIKKTKPFVSKGKKIVRKGISKARSSVRKARRIAEARGKKILRS